MGEREEADRISKVAMDLAFEVAANVVKHVGAACGGRKDIVNYIVGTAFLSVGMMMMRKHGPSAVPGMDLEREVQTLAKDLAKMELR